LLARSEHLLRDICPEPGLPPHECHDSFEQCLDRCNLRCGVQGADNTCAARCTARNCTNGTGGDEPCARRGGGRAGGGPRGAGRPNSCGEMFANVRPTVLAKLATLIAPPLAAREFMCDASQLVVGADRVRSSVGSPENRVEWHRRGYAACGASTSSPRRFTRKAAIGNEGSRPLSVNGWLCAHKVP
jgi:hypothetical protein